MQFEYKTKGTCSQRIFFEIEDGKVKTSRTPTYPEEWKNQFGLPVEEHQKSLQINIFDGYAVFGNSALFFIHFRSFHYFNDLYLCPN